MKSEEEIQRILQHREEYRKKQAREYKRKYYRKKHPLKEKEIKKCSFCGKEEHFAKGLCNKCYHRYRRNGKVEYVREFLTEEERIRRKRENNRIRCKRYRHKHIEQERERNKKYYRTHKEEIKMRRLKKRGIKNDK
jgi:hypothetical protein